MDRLADEHARPKGIILLARDAQGVPAGCGMSHALDAQTSEIKRVFVTEAARGQTMRDFMQSNCKQHGYSTYRQPRHDPHQ